MPNFTDEAFVLESRSIASAQVGKPRGLREKHYSLPLPANRTLKIEASFMGDYELMCLVTATDGRVQFRRNSYEGNGDITLEPTLDDRVVTVTAMRKTCNHRTELSHCSTLAWQPCVTALLISESENEVSVGWDDQREVYQSANVKAVFSLT